ncbi:glycosyltransferase family 4 protein [Actinoplanes aureus]|uniref:Glycosyltransferase family 4 protein n=1 Tax=Actinoplanes aureus TaxID=2792083 RepID=A0A931C580_9ACTN|nr:glycosyltransferase family 4 protein [Actinoplanes aureus]MBG0562459.1 glycosyltransferase family 4 protein [Actinoplanes aureus]
MQDNAPRVVHVSTVHPWTDNRVFRRECRTLARSGYDVTLIAVADEAQHCDGVRVIPAAQARTRLGRMVGGVIHAFGLAWNLKADIYHLHDPELILLTPFLRLRGSKVVYDAHEDLPEQVLGKDYLPAVSRRAVALACRGLCRFVGRASNHVVTATPTIAARFAPRPATVVHNYPELLPHVDGLVPYEAREDVVVYTGALGVLRGAAQMVDAMAAARLDGWRLRLVGPFRPATLTDELATRPGWSWVHRMGTVSPLEARRLTSTAKIGLLVLQPSTAYRDSMPTKLFEYMAAGIPVIASDFPLWRSIVEELGCGLLVDPTKPEAIATALRELAEDPARAQAMGERGRQAVLHRLNWSTEERALLHLYDRLRGAA